MDQANKKIPGKIIQVLGAVVDVVRSEGTRLNSSHLEVSRMPSSA